MFKMCLEFFFYRHSPLKQFTSSTKAPGGSHPVQVEPILRTIVLRIGIICNYRDLTRCRKVFCI